MTTKLAARGMLWRLWLARKCVKLGEPAHSGPASL